jgi:hypothetical protein
VEKVVNIIKQIEVGNLVVGLVILLIGIAIYVFKPNLLFTATLIHNLNEKSEDYLIMFFGLFLAILGGIVVLYGFNFEIMNYFNSLMSGGFPLLFAFLFAILCLFVIVWIRTKKEKNKQYN